MRRWNRLGPVGAAVVMILNTGRPAVAAADPAEVAQLARLLGQPSSPRGRRSSEPNRQEVAHRLGQIGPPAAAAVPALAALLDDDTATAPTREAAAVALGRIGPAAAPAAAALAHQVLTAQPPIVAFRSAIAIERIGPGATAAVPDLVATVTQMGMERREAARAVGAIGPAAEPLAGPALRALLADPDPSVRGSAALGLSRLLPPASPEAKEQLDVACKAVAEGLATRSLERTQECAYLAGDIGPAVVPTLADVLSNPNGEGALGWTAFALAEANDPWADPDLSPRENGIGERWQHEQRLRHLDPAAVATLRPRVPVLLQVINSRARFHTASAQVLGLLFADDPDTVKALVQIATGGNQIDLHAAAGVVLAGKAALPALRAVAARGGPPAKAARALMTAITTGARPIETPDVPPVPDFVGVPPPRQQRQVVLQLVKSGLPGVPKLVQALGWDTDSHGPSQVRGTAIRGLAAHLDAALPELRKALTADSLPLRAGAADAVAQLHATDLEPDVLALAGRSDPNAVPPPSSDDQGFDQQIQLAAVTLLKGSPDRLTAAATSPAATLRMDVVTSLSWSDQKTPAQARMLYELFRADPDERIRTAARQGVLNFPRSSLPPLLEDVRSPDPQRRRTAVGVLTEMDLPAAQAAVAAARSDADPTVRVAAVSAGGPRAQAGSPPPSPAAGIAALSDPDPAVRRAAANKITYSLDPAVTTAMARLVHDPDPAIRTAVAQHYLNAHSMPPAIPAEPELVPLLIDVDPTVRLKAQDAIRRCDTTAVVPSLLTIARGRPVRDQVAAVLALASATTPDADGALLAAAASPDSNVRMAAVTAMAARPAASLDRLLALARLAAADPDEAVQLQAAASLAAQRPALGRRAPSSVPGGILAELRRILAPTTAPTAGVPTPGQMQAALALAAVAPVPDFALPTLLKMARGADRRAAQTAAGLLFRFQFTAARSQLVDAAYDATGAPVAAVLPSALVPRRQAVPDPGWDRVAALLKSTDPETRRIAAVVVWPTDRTVPDAAVLDALNSPDPVVQAGACGALAVSGFARPIDCVGPLLKATADPSWSVVAAAVSAAGTHGAFGDGRVFTRPPDQTAWLTDHAAEMTDTDPAVRLAAVRRSATLGLGASWCEPTWQRLVLDGDPAVRAAALAALRSYHDLFVAALQRK